MKKTFLVVATIAVVGLGSAFLDDPVHAEPINDSQIQNERSAIKADLSEAEAKIADVLIDLTALNKQIEQVDDALAANQNKLDETEDRISDTEDEVENMQDDIDNLEEKIQKRYTILKQRVKSYQRNGGNISYLEVFFGSQNFGDLISRVSAVTKIADSDADLMEQQEKDKAELKKKQDVVKNKLADLNDMKTELVGMQETIEAQKKQNEQKKTDLKKKQQGLLDLKKELQMKDSNLAAIEAQVSRSLAENSSGSSTPESSASGGQLTTLSSQKNNSPNQVAASGSISTAVNAGYKYLGKPYRWAGKSPSTGFDCSGFVSWAYGQAGYSIPSSTSGLSHTGSKVSYSNIQPGDLVFFNTYKTNGHVGIYVGGGKFIGSQDSGLGVASMNNSYWKGHFSGHVRRVQ